MSTNKEDSYPNVKRCKKRKGLEHTSLVSVAAKFLSSQVITASDRAQTINNACFLLHRVQRVVN